MAKKSILDLKKVYGGKFRVQLDESATIDGQGHEDRLYCIQLAGSRGHVFLQAPQQLGAFLDRSPTNAWGQRLRSIPSVQMLQHGDHEFSVTFDRSGLDLVAEVLGLRKKRHVDAPSEAQLAARAAFAQKHRKPTEGELEATSPDES